MVTTLAFDDASSQFYGVYPSEWGNAAIVRPSRTDGRIQLDLSSLQPENTNILRVQFFGELSIP